MINVTPKSARPGALQVTEYRKQKEQTVNAADGKKESFDQLLISKTNQISKPVPNERQFVNALKNQISTEVNRGASEYKMADLSKQIALGEYDINPADIARKMMISGEDK